MSLLLAPLVLDEKKARHELRAPIMPPYVADQRRAQTPER